MSEHYSADWDRHDGMPHRGIYCVRDTTTQKVFCTTNPFKDGWEKAEAIARALNEAEGRESHDG